MRWLSRKFAKRHIDPNPVTFAYDTEDLRTAIYVTVGAATAGLWRRSGEVFPSEEICAAIEETLTEHGYPELVYP